MIKNIVFDLGGVVITIDHEEALRRFTSLGLTNAETLFNPYTQLGINGDLEEGKITADEYQKELSRIIGRDVSHKECAYAWQGYLKEVPSRNLKTLLKLRSQGYRVILLSNTNPFMMEWGMSPAFDSAGHSIQFYFDALYLSYQEKMMKPDVSFFMRVLINENILPEETLFVDDGARNVATASQLGIKTYCPENGSDWTLEIYNYL